MQKIFEKHLEEVKKLRVLEIAILSFFIGIAVGGSSILLINEGYIESEVKKYTKALKEKEK